MSISRIRKTFTVIFAIVALILFSYAFSSDNVSANTVSVGTSLFTDIDNISINSIVTGLELSSKGKKDTSVKYAKKLYFGDFNFEFIITEANFESFVFTVQTEHGDKNYMGTIDDSARRWVIKFTKKDSGFDASIYNVKDKEEDENVTVTQSFDASFTGNIKLGYNKDTKKFYIVAGSSSKDLDLVVDLYRNEGEITLGFEGVQMGGTAKALIKKINGQSFVTSLAGYAEDNDEPVMRIITELLDYDNSDYVEVPLNKIYAFPVYGLDVLSETIKYEIMTLYSADETFDEEDEENEDNKNTFTSVNLSFKKEGYYKITSIKIKDNNGNEQNKCVDLGTDYDFVNDPIIIHAVKWNDSPEVGGTYSPVIENYDDFLAELDNYVNSLEDYLPAGETHKFRFKEPLVKINCTPDDITENSGNIKFRLWYKEYSSGTFTTYQDSLIFTPRIEGIYDFKIQAFDIMGNFSNETPVFSLRFKDVTPPKILISGFVTEKYLNQSVTLPQGSIMDDLSSSLENKIKVYYFEKDENGNTIYEEDGVTPKKTLVSEAYTFTPNKLGWYEVIYSSKDAAGNLNTLSPMWFNVIDAEAPSPEPFIDLTNTWNIIFLCIAGASALGLIILIFIKPKENE
jgi:hypothetical protein